MSSVNAAVGLRAYQTVLTATTSPQQVLDQPTSLGRHFVSIIYADTPTFIGSIELIVVDTSADDLVVLNSTDSVSQVNPGVFNFNSNYDTVTFTFNNGYTLVNTQTTDVDLIIHDFIVPVGFTGTNIMAIDNIIPFNTGSNSVAVSASLVSSYTGANAINFGQATVSQSTSISDAVTLNGASGVITTVVPSLAAGATSSFTVTNSVVSSTSSVVVGICSYTGDGLPYVAVTSVSSGSFTIKITNIATTGSLDSPVGISFVCA